MKKAILKPEQIHRLVLENRYPVHPKDVFISRCIDGRYETVENLPALAFPGADAGELALVLAAGNHYGFSVDFEKATDALLAVVGSVKRFQLHSDNHGDPKIPASGCGHIKQILLDPAAYYLEKQQTHALQKKLVILRDDGARETILKEDHGEGSVIQIKGNWGIYPGYILSGEDGNKAVQTFIYHQTLVARRHQALAEKLIKHKAVILLPDQNQEFLYGALSEIAEDHLFETAKRLAAGLPLYEVAFRENGDFDIEELGTV